MIEVTDPAATEGGGLHWLLTRRRISDGELAFYRARAPGHRPSLPLPVTNPDSYMIAECRLEC